MPTYEYACRSCGKHQEVQQHFADDPLTTCPSCGGELRKVFGNIAISFKGRGFYSTDNRSDSKAGGAGGASGESSDGSSKSGTSSDSKSTSSESGGSGSGGSGSGGSGSGSGNSKSDKKVDTSKGDKSKAAAS
ncbi:MAG: FmdB family transcriptional regulator [Actinomycetota bacterium]|nr:FmdB family transcriptional regulator [Actinomycetota bacterium]